MGLHFLKIRPQTWPDLQEILKTGRPQIGKRINLPQASIIANRTPIVIGNEIVGVISVFQDISEYEKIITELQGFQKLHARLESDVFLSSANVLNQILFKLGVDLRLFIFRQPLF